jgi:LysM repeat protein
MLSLVLIACFSEGSTSPASSLVESPVAAAPVHLGPTPLATTLPSVVLPPAQAVAFGQDEGFVRISVRHGETLEQLARLSGTVPETLASLNHIDVKATLKAGDELVVPEAETFDARRAEQLDERLFRFAERRGGLVGMGERSVATGETAWGIARDEQVPLWVLAGFNPGTTLDRLAVGDKLHVPMLADAANVPTQVGLASAGEVIEEGDAGDTGEEGSQVEAVVLGAPAQGAEPISSTGE